jgi:hypothetical protein
MSLPRTLAELQGWLFDSVTQAPAPAEQADALVSAGGLPASARIAVYRRGYVARLVECLQDDYPALEHALGHGAFERLCHDFIAQHPPASPSLNYYGAPFARYCAARPERWNRFASELAELEWAIVEAIHAEEGERLDVAALARLAPEDWARARLVPSPALRLLHATYPVAQYYQAFQEGSAPAERWPEPEPCALAVCRRGADVWRFRLTPALAPLLGALSAGTPLLQALELLSGSAPEAAQELQQAFQDWVACGLFAAVALD